MARTDGLRTGLTHKGWILVTVLFLAPLPGFAEWNFVNPTPHGHHLWASAYCSGTWVSVGQYGLVYTSTDGIQWQRQESGTTAYLSGVACNAVSYTHLRAHET